MSTPRRRVLERANRLVGQADAFRRISAQAGLECNECLKPDEVDRIHAAVESHRKLMAERGIPFQMTLLHGSALYVPYWRRLLHHYHFPKSCKVCQAQQKDFEVALEKKPTFGDVDLVTVGIPSDKSREFIGTSFEGPLKGRVDLFAHVTDQQLADPSHVYTSFFNMWNFKIPHERAAVNDIKFARHFAAVLHTITAYPVVDTVPQAAREKAKALAETRARFMAHLPTLTDEQLKEFNRVFTWFLRREGYCVFRPGVDKKERQGDIAHYSKPKSGRIHVFGDEFLFHLNMEHRAEQMRMLAAAKKLKKR